MDTPPEIVADTPPDVLPELVTLADAAKRWQVSARTLRRRIDAGAIPGAVKINSPAGDMWHLPAVEVAALGYRERPPEPLSGAALERANINELLTELAAVLERTQASADKAHADHAKAAAEAAKYAEQVRQLTADRDALAAELADARKPRRWWQR